jgi:dephospho-CoA kinase
MARVLGITGNIACGKTTIGQILLELGASLYIDADAVVHELYALDQPLNREITQVFGESVQNQDGTINRKALGSIVFQDPMRLRELESMLHPLVTAKITERIVNSGEDETIIIDAVKLLEGGLKKLCHSTWLITCSLECERQRLMSTRGMSLSEAEARISVQPDNNKRSTVVDEIIDNSGTLDDTRKQVEFAWERFHLKFSGEKS